MKIVTKR